MLNVVLVSPEIPPNTGNVIRLCANTGARLHLVEPLGFSLESAKLRRAGLDYHEFASIRVHRSWEALCEAHRLFSPAHPEAMFDPERDAAAPIRDAADPTRPPNGASQRGDRLPRVFALTTTATRSPFDIEFARGDWLVFGCETRGLPAPVLACFAEQQRLRLPMRPGNRSLNLSNAVAVTVFEAWRQFGFEGAADKLPASTSSI
ncbi:MAG: tRNA (cytidine(34)-2'-O)-methyltransferase [Limnobacter sp.]|nr:tRNA (cytidine(34)-2'-O)-methyltransferase [Limnobacter sp.]